MITEEDEDFGFADYIVIYQNVMFAGFLLGGAAGIYMHVDGRVC